MALPPHILFCRLLEWRETNVGVGDIYVVETVPSLSSAHYLFVRSRLCLEAMVCARRPRMPLRDAARSRCCVASRCLDMRRRLGVACVERYQTSAGRLRTAVRMAIAGRKTVF